VFPKLCVAEVLWFFNFFLVKPPFSCFNVSLRFKSLDRCVAKKLRVKIVWETMDRLKKFNYNSISMNFQNYIEILIINNQLKIEKKRTNVEWNGIA
jgi:hypothetical protein